MNQKKEIRKRKKEQRKIARNAKSLSKKRDFYKNLLDFAGCLDDFARLPDSIKQFVYNLSWPQITIVVEDGTTHPNLEDIKESIKHLLNVVCIPVGEDKIPISNIFGLHCLESALNGVYLDTNNFLNDSSKKDKLISSREKRAIEKNKQSLSIVLSNCKTIISKLSEVLKIINPKYVDYIAFVATQEVLKYFSFQEFGLYPVFSVGDSKGKKYPIITIKSFNPKAEQITVDGGSRKSYKCYNYDLLGISPIFLSAGVVDNKTPIPVHIQEHAINRMIERLGISPLGYMFDCLGRSLSKPILSGNSGPSYLLEFNYYSNKLGYLLISNEGDFAVVRSFKFITMTGTPEFYNLKKALKGSREDFEYLGLDTLETLLNSDISKDTKLREIFESCGLGHLFTINHLQFAKPESSVAEEIKQYFRL
jgi:hypothetical protein